MSPKPFTSLLGEVKGEEIRIALYCIISITVVLVAYALHWLGPVLVPLVLAIMLSFVLSPLVDFQVQRCRLPQEIAVINALLLSVGVLAAIMTFWISSIKELVVDMEQYETSVKKLGLKATKMLDRRGAEILSAQIEFAELPVGFLAQHLRNMLQKAAELLELTFLVLVFGVYLLLARKPGTPTALPPYCP
ncbi:hypothetical protein CYMTET_51177, partial [Cymbomonas tetramitiformis]